MGASPENVQASPHAASHAEASSSAGIERAWKDALGLPCDLSIELAVPGLTVGDLLALEVNSVIDSRTLEGSPLPIWVNKVMIGWAEFDVVGKHLGVRVTELR